MNSVAAAVMQFQITIGQSSSGKLSAPSELRGEESERSILTLLLARFHDHFMNLTLWTSALVLLMTGSTRAGLDISASSKPVAPSKSDSAVLVHHATDDKGGNTSLRFVENRKVDENKYPTNSVTVFAQAPREQPQRDRDLGQTFLTGEKGGKLDALFLRVGHADLAMLTNTPDPANKFRGHGIRREGLPAFPDDAQERLKQPPVTLGFPDVCTFRDLHFAVTLKY